VRYGITRTLNAIAVGVTVAPVKLHSETDTVFAAETQVFQIQAVPAQEGEPAGDEVAVIAVVAPATATVTVAAQARYATAAPPTFPVVAERCGVDHVPSPRQNVVALAPPPAFKFVTGKFPDTSVASATDPKVGAPAALPCKTVVVVPTPIVLGVAPAPPPIITAFAVSSADDAIVPAAVKPRMPPLFPAANAVPPRATARRPDEMLPALSVVNPAPEPVKALPALFSVSALP